MKKGLTKRHVDVMRGILEGMSNKEVADSLGIKRNTAEFPHLQFIYEAWPS